MMENAANAVLTIHFAPLLPMPLLWLALSAAALLFSLSVIFFRRGILGRSLCTGVFVLSLLNPVLVEEQREGVSDVALIVTDTSQSQEFGARAKRTADAVAYLRERLKSEDNLEVRVAEAPDETQGVARETRLFAAAEQALADIPASRRAGIIMITDGQVHDAPETADKYSRDNGPLHVLITGDKNERDRQLSILEAPAYGIVGQDVTIRYRVEDPTAAPNDRANVTIRQDGMNPRTDSIAVNQDRILRVRIDHAGQNVVQIEAEGTKNELTIANNRAPVIINGVRDRLRVLLVSGQPHAGGRTWRDLLTSDPGVDLVHFTILREPHKMDFTAQNELSLIAFPFRELFEIKLYDFDLIIFDRYSLNRILPNYYFGNIAKYVREGGALLEASGPAFAGADSIYTTELKDILPAAPTGEVMEQSYKPVITNTGHRHPVTQDMRWSLPGRPDAAWGSWLRQVSVDVKAGDVLMTGNGDKPLLILNRVGEGRVAQLASDQIWLWSRGFEGGGPQAELLRRLAHWLMKEPELEENALTVKVSGDTILVRRRSLTADPLTIDATDPAGIKSTITLTSQSNGYLEARMQADQLGIYTFKDNLQEQYAVVGDLNPPELRAVRATGERLAPAVAASGGTVIWLADHASPNVRNMSDARMFGGRDWVGLRRNNAHQVTGVRDTPFLPDWLWVVALMAAILAAWRHEGQIRKPSAPLQ